MPYRESRVILNCVPPAALCSVNPGVSVCLLRESTLLYADQIFLEELFFGISSKVRMSHILKKMRITDHEDRLNIGARAKVAGRRTRS